jgi:ABC-type phosphate/phosphonate transport system substrate-binding protein
MIANARMYSVTPAVAELWRQLLGAIAAQAKVDLVFIEHPEPRPITELWRRRDLGAVFMCGLPFARSEPRPEVISAPVPAPAAYGGQPRYWSEFVVREDSGLHALEQTLGCRIAFTTPDSQSGCVAALCYFMDSASLSKTVGQKALYREVIAPQVTPLRALKAVIDGLADVAPIDSFAFHLMRRYRPELTRRVRVIAQTAPTAIPPIVASSPGLLSLETAFVEAHNDPSMRPLLQSLELERFVRPDSASYDLLRQRFKAATAYWATRPFAAAAHPAFAALSGGRLAPV